MKKSFHESVYWKPISFIELFELRCKDKINIKVEFSINSKFKDKKLLSKLSNELDTLWEYKKTESDSS